MVWSMFRRADFARAQGYPPRISLAWIDYHNDARAPLLFISGSEDHLMPPSIQKEWAERHAVSKSPLDEPVPGRG